jgi:alkylated DNA repair dioxygenase AlkB
MMGVAARRKVIHYGFDYDYDGWSIRPTDPIPDFLEPLVLRCAAAAGVERDALRQMLVARYPPGATIGWHRDAPMFGSPVIGVSLASPCTMRFRRRRGDGWERESIRLDPRSLYVLDGQARSAWQHSIPPTPALRYSITLRTLRETG